MVGTYFKVRPPLREFMDVAQPILKTQLGPGSGPTYRP